MPHNPIINYLTMYSGITPRDLEGVTTSLAEVQKKLREVLPKDCILVGHSLENDLHALKVCKLHDDCSFYILLYCTVKKSFFKKKKLSNLFFNEKVILIILAFLI